MGELLEQNLFLSLIVEANDTPCIIMVLEEEMVVGEAIIVVIPKFFSRHCPTNTAGDRFWNSIPRRGKIDGKWALGGLKSLLRVRGSDFSPTSVLFSSIRAVFNPLATIFHPFCGILLKDFSKRSLVSSELPAFISQNTYM